VEAHQVVAEQGQRREYSRVEAYIPFAYRIVAPDEKDHIQAVIPGHIAATDFRPVPDMAEYDHVLGEWFAILNSKLDTIIRLMTLQREGFFGLPFKAVNISGGGMSFFLPQSMPFGEVLEIKAMLTRPQTVALRIYGEIVKSEQRNGSYFTAVRYIHMDDIVRDEIIRFVFEREREIIREKRG
jgi:c-di-GMP-binding flagellar brake protein YcgR